MSGLKSCPFCGGEAKIENNDRVIYDPDTLGFVDVEYGDPPCVWTKCCSCDAFVGGFDTEEEAIAAWNRRVEGWISVSERLPDIGENVLIATISERTPVSVAWRGIRYEEDQEFTWRSFDGLMLPEHVTHWMPLPSTEGIKNDT